ncbi:MAG TPA: L-ribulose-5-phosphate 4-epimerase [Halanaerobiaceae bacterium]|jgi:L-ribulose-5-phosphate 4-epimerase|nr:L-ribulose-5-phosphate 4-epimerase [Halanaerobiaceae bacterium]HOA40019.1 L-ribulose-5-phosphate 4-epimerase [Halanaerobiales bacterium]HPZ62095.1 L-ribulose-5-phosphate 4-epimerase [Halanaerobiales bacterium]HQD03408.1 L-ribulose-5-phosphate 4-epimerase [Halanaerobiales bacterium]
MLKDLKERVLEANLELQRRNLVIYTWGNVSGIDREKGLVVIKPSGVPYEDLTVDKLVVLDLEGNKVEGDLNPSSDTATHIELYKSFPEIGGVVHTHSVFATAWAQAGKSIPCLGTTHADYFHGAVPCTRLMKREEVEGDYERNTGKLIVETFEELDYNYTPGVLVAGHGPFTWGTDPANAVHNSVVLEELARMALYSISINPASEGIPAYILNKHFYRKHGEDAYYGQKG